jgi:hypothetical protein
MKKIATITCLILFSFELQSQDSFTLNQAIEFGLINNSISKNAVNDLKIANAKKMGNYCNWTPANQFFY